MRREGAKEDAKKKIQIEFFASSFAFSRLRGA
jgi:hypothetical protein